MDIVALVENQIDEGQCLLDALNGNGVDVRAALWIKRSDKNRWLMYLATPLLEQAGRFEAVGKVFGVLRQLNVAWIDTSDLWIIAETDPIARDAIALRERYSGRGPIRLTDPKIGNLYPDEIFLYPLSKEKFTIYGLAFRGDPTGAVLLSLEPHNPHISLEIDNAAKYSADTGLDWQIAAPEGSRLERNEAGHLKLKWNLHGKGKESDANEVLALADLGYHGFRVLRQPVRNGR